VETFIVRVFTAEDLDGLNGTIERPGGLAVPFHGANDLIDRLIATRPERPRGPGDDEPTSARHVHASSTTPRPGLPGAEGR
jgi:hypothetical protein